MVYKLVNLKFVNKCLLVQVTCSYQCSDQIQTANLGKLKPFVIKSEDNCEKLKFIYVSEYKRFKQDLYFKTCKYKL